MVALLLFFTFSFFFFLFSKGGLSCLAFDRDLRLLLVLTVASWVCYGLYLLLVGGA